MANSESELSRDLRRLSDVLTKLFQDEIERQDLIDTGLMLKTTRAFIVKEANGFSFKVESTDYFPYVDDKFNVTQNVLRSNGYQKFLEDIAIAYEKYITNEIIQ